MFLLGCMDVSLFSLASVVDKPWCCCPAVPCWPEPCRIPLRLLTSTVLMPCGCTSSTGEAEIV